MTGRWAREIMGRSMSRRDFLKVAGAVAIVTATGTTGCSSPAGSATTAPSPATVPAKRSAAGAGKLIVSTDTDPGKAVDKALDAYGGLTGLIRQGDKVLIKPNFTFARTPAQGAANHPDVLARIALRCREAGASEVVLVDHTIDSGALCLQKSGIKAGLGAAGFTALCINDKGDFEECDVPGTVLKSTQIAKRLADADVFINAPVIKSHGNTLMTAGMKNLMGLIWDRQRPFHDPGPLDDCIVDLAGLLKPDLVIADAYRVLKTNGPGGPGDVIEPHEVIVSDDTVAADAYAATLLGLKPEEVGHIRLAAEAGLGKMDLLGLTRV